MKFGKASKTARTERDYMIRESRWLAGNPMLVRKRVKRAYVRAIRREAMLYIKEGLGA